MFLINQGNHNKENIEQRIKGLQEKLEALNEAAKRRQDGLVDNSAFLQFLWKTDVVESWIADKETQVRSDDYGRDLSSVQTLLTKQVNINHSLTMYIYIARKNVIFGVFMTSAQHQDKLLCNSHDIF